MFVSGWGADYLDPQNFLDILFQSQSEENQCAYSNPAVDSALKEAAIEQDSSLRLKKYQDIEKIILNDFAVIPFCNNYKDNQLIKPYVNGLRLFPMGINIWARYFYYGALRILLMIVMKNPIKYSFILLITLSLILGLMACGSPAPSQNSSISTTSQTASSSSTEIVSTQVVPSTTTTLIPVATPTPTAMSQSVSATPSATPTTTAEKVPAEVTVVSNKTTDFFPG